ncbi:MAG TPA: stalk domain-containing protein, partial [Clostridia bacterium]|nr:stalk domain-containing protein [Clostridia bacterium]
INEEPGDKHFIYCSMDGIKWDITEFNGPSVYWSDFFTYDNNKYYINRYDFTSRENIIYESNDLKIWKKSNTEISSILYHINQTTYRLGDGINRLEKGVESLEYQSDSIETLNGMCSGNGKLAAVGTNGLIVFSSVSDKSKKWLLANIQPFKDIYSAISNKTCIVAVGKDGQIIKSTDGAKWQIVNTDIPYSLHSVIYDGTYFIAAGDEGTLARSKDGSTWTLLESNTGMDLYSLKKLNNTYIAVGKSATILTSKDASSWKLVFGIEKDNRTLDEPFSGVTYKDGTYYTISNMNSYVYTSKDAVTWKKTSRLKGSNYVDLIYYKGRFVLIGRNMSISKDMKTETINKEGFYSASGAECQKVNAFSDFLLTGAPDGNIYFSSDGILWQDAGGLKVKDCINSIVEFKGSYYGFSNDGIIIKGVKKGTIPSDSDITVSAYYNYPQFGDSQAERFETLKNQPIYRNNTMLLTVDTIAGIIGSDYNYDKKKKIASISIGKKTIRYTAGATYAVVNGKRIKMAQKAEAAGNSLYVPAQFTLNSLGYTFSYDSSERRIYTTVDDTPKNKSLVFKRVSMKNNSSGQYFQSVCSNGKVYLSITNDGSIYRSKDGANWAKSAELKGVFSKVLWNGKRFMAVGGASSYIKADGLIYVSEDGLNWRKAGNIPTSKYLYAGVVASSGKTSGEAYTGSLLKQTVLLSYDGAVLTSQDGLKWNKSTDAKTKYFSGLCGYKGVYYSVCSGKGIVYYSKDGLLWNYYKVNIPISRVMSSGGTLWAVNDYGKPNMESAKLYKSKNGKDWTYVQELPNKNINSVFYAGNKYILAGYRCSSKANTESLGFAMVSGGGDLWDFAAVPAGMEFTNEVFRYGKLTLVATSKGLFMLTVK